VFVPALVFYFKPAVPILEMIASLEEQEFRRSIGVAVHFFAKRRPKDAKDMKRLLSLLSLLVEDRRVLL
jgi:hypothetical protein